MIFYKFRLISHLCKFRPKLTREICVPLPLAFAVAVCADAIHNHLNILPMRFFGMAFTVENCVQELMISELHTLNPHE